MAVFLAHLPGIDSHNRLFQTGNEATALGNSIARHGRFANPFAPQNTGPSAHAAPGFPLIVAAVIKLAGDGPRGAFVLDLCALTALGLQLALLPHLALVLGLEEIVGIVAALLLLIGDYVNPAWEANYVGLLIVILSTLILDLPQHSASKMRILGIGITSGMLLLFSPAVLLVIAAWLTWMYIYRKVPATDIALALLVALIVIAPWLARNYAVFHRFVFIRDNFGLELAISNSDCATAWYENNLQSRCFVQQHPNMSSGESARVLALGEVEYNRQKLYDAVMWITRNPGRFTDLTRERIVAFWTGGLFSLGVSIGKFLSTVMIVLGICGLWKLRYSCRGSAAFLGLGLLFFAPPYYLVQFTDRYSFPILWATFLPGTYVLLELLAGRFIVGNKRRQAGQSPDDKFIAVE